MVGSTPVPGWYPDASNGALMRWWDGAQWTDHVQPLPAAPATVSAAVPSAGAAAPQPEPAAFAATFTLPPQPEAQPRGAVTTAPVGTTSSDSLRAAPPPGQRMLTRRELRALEASSAASGEGAPSGPGSPSTSSTPSAEGADHGATAATTAATAATTPPPLEEPTQRAASIPGMIVPSTTGPTGVVPANLGPVDTRTLPHSAMSASSSASASSTASAESSGSPESAPTASAPAVAPAPPAASAPTTSAPAASGIVYPSAPATEGASATEPNAGSASAPASAATYAAVPAGGAPAWSAPSTFAVPQSAAELASVDYEPMGRNWARTTTPRTPTPERSGTVGAWMLALSPLVGPLFAIGGAALLVGGSLATATAIVTEGNLLILGGSLAAVALASILYLIIAVVIDRRRLGMLGHTHRASGWWILLGPFIYLIARTVRVVRESGKGTAPLWTFIGTSVLITALAVAAPFVVPRQASIAEMRAVEASINADLAGEAGVARVLCPDSADARIGSVFRCDALDADGGVLGLVTVRWSGIDGGVEYWVDFGSGGIDAAG